MKSASVIDKISVLTDDVKEPLGLYVNFYKSKRWNKLIVTISREENAKFKGTKFAKKISPEVII